MHAFASAYRCQYACVGQHAFTCLRSSSSPRPGRPPGAQPADVPGQLLLRLLWESSSPLDPVDIDVLQGGDASLGNRDVRGKAMPLVAHYHARIPGRLALAHHVLCYLGSYLAHGIRIQHDDQLGDEVIVKLGIDWDGLWIRHANLLLLPQPWPARGTLLPMRTCERRRPSPPGSDPSRPESHRHQAVGSRL